MDLAAIIPDESVEVDLRSGWGATGLKQWGGLVREEFLPELSGKQGLDVFKEMGDNDATCSTILYTIDKLCRKVDWRVSPASSRDFDREAADFLESCLHDMEETWTDTVAEFLSMLQYGFSLHGMVFKRRMGYLGRGSDPARCSKYSDGRVGLLGLPIRSQDTLYRWLIDERGRILGAEQVAPPHFRVTTIPMSKSLLFRTTKHKNNPEGRSILRGAYRSWYLKRAFENIEAVGAERDVAGLPIAFAPPAILNAKPGTPEFKVLTGIKDIVTSVRNDEQAGIVFPMAFDANGKQLFDFKLLNAGGSKQFDTDKIINRYDQRIAMSVLADWLLLGQGAATGSWAMHSDKTQIFADATDVFQDIIAETFNRVLVPLLFRMNNFRVSEYPQLEHAKIAKQDLKEIGAYIQQLSAAGMPLFPNPDLEQHLHQLADLPAPLDLEVPLAGAEDVQPQAAANPENVSELHDESSAPTVGHSTDDAEAAQNASQVFGRSTNAA